MTTLRDYILDCRCPNCGLLMRQQAPAKKSWWATARTWMVTLLVIGSAVDSLTHDYAMAAYGIGIATFLVVTER